MAEKLGDGGYWLPSEILTDDDLLMDFKAEGLGLKKGDGFLYGFGSGSDLSSPVESVAGSTEVEIDEKDFIALLNRKIAYRTFHEMKTSSDYPTKGRKLCGSPQSTLFGCKPCPSISSPKYVCELSSKPEVKDSVEWDLIYAAAEEIARMRVKEDTTGYYPTRTFSQSVKPPCPVTFSRTNPSVPEVPSDFYSNLKTQAQISYQQLRAAQLTQIQRGNWSSGITDQFYNVKCERVPGLSTTAWPTLSQSQQQPKIIAGTGMRAVFLPENGAKKERTGTGVFLPRRYGVNSTQSETHKKPGCSPVLLPDRVVHALNLNLDSIDTPASVLSRSNANLPPQYEAALKQRANAMMAQQQMRNFKPQQGLNQDFRLPPEWTY